MNQTENINELKDSIHSVINQMQGKIPAEMAPVLEEAFLKMESEGIVLKDALGLNPEIVENMYEQGYHLFKSGKFKEALPFFNFLRLLDNLDPRFPFAIAACYHHNKNYAEAVSYYIMHEILEPTDPLAYYHLYDCFSKLNLSLLAINALRAAHRLAEQNSKYSELKGKAEMELQRLQALDVNETATQEREFKE